MTNYLSREQVRSLNEKHGWFQYGDAQSDVSNAFANEAVRIHERVRAAAPELLKVVEGVIGLLGNCSVESGVCCCGDSMEGHSTVCGHSPVDSGARGAEELYCQAVAALAKVKGEKA